MIQKVSAAIKSDTICLLQRRLEAVTGTWTFDLLVRGIFVAWFFYQVYGKVAYLIDYYDKHGLAFDAMFVTAFLARTAVTLFLASLIGVVLFRLRPVKKSQGVAPRVAAFFGTFTLMLLPLFPVNEMSPTGNLIATALIISGSGLGVYIVFWLGRSFSIMPEARRLVTGGPYAFIRHPLYVAEEISLIGVYLLYASVGTTALLILHAYLQVKRMGYEEQILRMVFPEYDDYARRTWRVIPGLY